MSKNALTVLTLVLITSFLAVIFFFLMSASASNPTINKIRQYYFSSLIKRFPQKIWSWKSIKEYVLLDCKASSSNKDINNLENQNTVSRIFLEYFNNQTETKDQSLITLYIPKNNTKNPEAVFCIVGVSQLEKLTATYESMDGTIKKLFTKDDIYKERFTEKEEK